MLFFINLWIPISYFDIDVKGPARLVSNPLYFMIALLLSTVFFAIFEASKYKATIGKIWVEAYTVTAENKPINFCRAVVRFAICQLASVVFLTLLIRGHIVYASACGSIIALFELAPMFFNKERRTFSDYITCTYVYLANKESLPTKEAAGLFRRFFAFLIDATIVLNLAVITLLSHLYAMAYLFSYLFPFIVILIFYFILFETSNYHASIGKKLLNLEVERNTGVPPWFIISLWRLLVYSISFGINFFILATAMAVPFEKVLCVMGIFNIIWYLPILFTENKACVHDLLSGTRVVRIK